MRDIFFIYRKTEAEDGGKKKGRRGKSARQEEVLELTGGSAGRKTKACCNPPQQSAQRGLLRLYLLKLCTIQRWLCLVLRSNSVVPNL